jgi:hypothetical protein
LLKRILAIAALILGTAAVIFWVVNLGPHGEPKPSVTDWISAVGTAAGAVGTAGALLLGVRVYYRQEKDQRRAQAAAVTVGFSEETHTVGKGIPRTFKTTKCYVRNASQLPIYRVMLYLGSDWDSKSEVRDVLAAGEESSFETNSTSATPVAKFMDTAGVAWKRDGYGQLRELKDEHGMPWEMN